MESIALIENWRTRGDVDRPHARDRGGSLGRHLLDFRCSAGLPRRRSLLSERDDILRSCQHNLEKRWQLLGALQSLNGMLLFGVTTAFLFGIIERARELQGGRPR
jgi:hypothetical protein